MIMEIGIGIMSFATGLFIGSMVERAKRSTEKKENIFTTWVQNQQIKKEQKNAEKAFREQLQQNARMEALKQMQPDLVKYMKELEIKKMTGQDKKDKLKKFADAFSLGNTGNGVGSDDKLNMMLGQQTSQQPTRNDIQFPISQQPQQQPDMFSGDKINMMLGRRTLEQQQSDKKSEEDRILSFFR